MPTHAETMVTKLETLLAANVGVEVISVDGQMVRYADLKREWQFWKRQVAEDAGTSPTSAGIKLDGF